MVPISSTEKETRIQEACSLKELGVPIAEIARRIGYSRETLYREFRKKEKGSTLTSTTPENSPTHEESTTTDNGNQIVADSSTNPNN